MNQCIRVNYITVLKLLYRIELYRDCRMFFCFVIVLRTNLFIVCLDVTDTCPLFFLLFYYCIS